MTNEEVLKKNNGRRFSIIIQNPPYDKNTHLKFIRKCLEIGDKVINISPLRWLQDPFHSDKRSTLKQFEDVAKHIESIEMMKNNGQFDIGIYSDLGIYVLDKNETDFDYENYWKEFKTNEEVSIIDKVCNKQGIKHLSDVVEQQKRDGIRVMIAHIGGNRGTLPIYKDIVYTVDGKVGDKDWTECKNMGGYEKPKGSPLPDSIKFNSVEEAENFYKSYRYTKLLTSLCDITIQQQNIPLNKLPFLDDYTHEITDDELFKLFDLNKEEIEYIKNFKLSRYNEKLKNS